MQNDESKGKREKRLYDFDQKKKYFVERKNTRKEEKKKSFSFLVFV